MRFEVFVAVDCHILRFTTPCSLVEGHNYKEYAPLYGCECGKILGEEILKATILSADNGDSKNDWRM
jgi:hypothetical protein